MRSSECHYLVSRPNPRARGPFYLRSAHQKVTISTLLDRFTKQKIRGGQLKPCKKNEKLKSGLHILYYGQQFSYNPS